MPIFLRKISSALARTNYIPTVMHNLMKDLSIDIKEIKLIKKLTELSSIEIIWDLNAFYFNSEIKTYKLECFVDKPEGSDFKYDEIFYCRFLELNERIEFEDENSKFWYKIISRNCKIIGINSLNVLELFPNNELIPTENLKNHKYGLNKLTLGLIIETDKGFIPAFLLNSNHGFHWQPKYGFYTAMEIEKLIAENIKYYEIKNCA